MNDQTPLNADEIIAEVNRLLDGEPEQEAPAADPKENYSEWLYQQSPREQVPPPRSASPKRRKKHTGLKVLLALVLVIVAAFAVLWFILARQPVAEKDTLGERKMEACTILLAGTDAGETRTDTMVLLHLDAPSQSISLISLPRDTYVSGGYSVPKLNSALGAGGGGADGMEELMDQVTKLIGYRPDGYVLVNLDGFRHIVDAIGGVEFDVPMDMHYSDPTQDLYIDLTAGQQRLNGEKAMELVRFRSGYAEADLARVRVQRDFLKAALQQTISAKNIVKAPALLGIVLANSVTDLDAANLAWLARTAMICDKEALTMETMPGSPRMISGGSYYVVDAYAAAELLNECCNPYQAEITADMLSTRG